jgi:hypothetical protein
MHEEIQYRRTGGNSQAESWALENIGNPPSERHWRYNRKSPVFTQTEPGPWNGPL